MCPKVTILMSVYNGEQYLAEAMNSMLTQTFTDYEFIIINDGSTDTSQEIIRSYDDPRIRYIQHPTNQGLITSLNEGIELANGAFIARMDCDDISYPDRLLHQVTFLEQHPEIGVCGGYHRFIGGNRSNDIWRSPQSHEEIACQLLFFNSLSHPTVTMRTTMLHSTGCRYRHFPHAEDYDLWAQLSKCTRLVNLPEILLDYRVHDAQVSLQHQKLQSQSAETIQKRLLTELGISFTDEEYSLHQQALAWWDPKPPDIGDKVIRWLYKLEYVNKTNHCYPEPTFTQIIREYQKLVKSYTAGSRNMVWQYNAQ